MKKNIVLLHGMLCDQSLWDDQKEALQPYGKLFFPNISQYDSLEKMATKVLEEIPSKFTLIGFSLGGQVALKITRIAPEKIEKLILISTRFGPLRKEVNDYFKEICKAIEEDPNTLDKFIERNKKAYFSENNQENLRERYSEMANRFEKKEVLNQLRALINQEEKVFPNITCPTLIIHGENDTRLDDESQSEMYKNIDDSKFINIPNVGHFVLWEQPEKINSILLEWLA